MTCLVTYSTWATTSAGWKASGTYAFARATAAWSLGGSWENSLISSFLRHSLLHAPSKVGVQNLLQTHAQFLVLGHLPLLLCRRIHRWPHRLCLRSFRLSTFVELPHLVINCLKTLFFTKAHSFFLNTLFDCLSLVKLLLLAQVLLYEFVHLLELAMGLFGLRQGCRKSIWKFCCRWRLLCINLLRCSSYFSLKRWIQSTRWRTVMESLLEGHVFHMELMGF